MDTDFTQVRRERKSKKSFTSALQNNLTKSTVFTNSNFHQSRLPVNSKLRAEETIAQEIEEHVKCLTKGEKVLCESIRTRFDSYSSYKISVPWSYMSAVSNVKNWPAGILIRRYYEK